MGFEMSSIQPWGEEPVTLSASEIQTHRKELAARVQTFDLAKPISEQEFDTALDWLFNFLLFDVKSWQGELIKDPQLRRDLPILESFPLYCKGRGRPRDPENPDDRGEPGCRYFKVCPVMRRLSEAEQDSLVGTPCRVDKHEGVRNFTAQVRELGITPDETSAIIQVAQLVRLLVLQRRIDWEFALNDIVYKEIATFNPQTGAPAYERRVNQLMKESRGIETQISRLQSQLLATRKDRAQIAQGLKQQDSGLRNLLMDAIRQDELREAQSQGLVEDAEFTVDDDQQKPE